MTSSEQPVYEYRVGFRLNNLAPRGGGTYYSDARSLKEAEDYLRRVTKMGKPSATDAMWVERRIVGPWEEVPDA